MENTTEFKLGDYVVIRETNDWVKEIFPDVRPNLVGTVVMGHRDKHDTNFPMVKIHATGDTLCFWQKQLEIIK